jgi:hypothetical protein
MVPVKADMPSILSRLLFEISWEGNAKTYRPGGQGRENVLTAEVFQALELLPREPFFCAVVESMHGADSARQQLVAEISGSRLELLPGEVHLNPEARGRREQFIVQPDGRLTSPSVYGLIEAKRIKPSAFQTHQLAREIVATMHFAGENQPLLILILGTPPPVKVRNQGPCSIEEAVSLCLDDAIANTPGFHLTAAEVISRITDTIAWTTWTNIAESVSAARPTINDWPTPAQDSADRAITQIQTAIRWHSGS